MTCLIPLLLRSLQPGVERARCRMTCLIPLLLLATAAAFNRAWNARGDV